MKYKKICPECGGTDIHVTEAHARGDSMNLLPKVGSFFQVVKFEAYICGSCGYYRLFVPEKFLADVIEKLPELSS